MLKHQKTWVCISASCAGASGQPFQVLHAANEKDSADNLKVSDPDLAYLMELGYERTQSVAALAQAQGDVSRALQLLFEDLTGTQHTLANGLVFETLSTSCTGSRSLIIVEWAVQTLQFSLPFKHNLDWLGVFHWMVSLKPAGIPASSSSTTESQAGFDDGVGMWEEEREALQAIYGDDMQTVGPDRILISVDVHGTRFVLDFRIQCQLCYPVQPPIIGVR